jgi:peptidoglycan/xylan/chitin deacetylase (PgdA/CDA1 family)
MIPPASQTDDRPSPAPLCLTLDVEADYGRSATVAILDKTDSFFDWIRNEHVPVTAFVTGRLIEQGHPIIDRLEAAGVAVELHGYAHAAGDFGTMLHSHAEEIERGTVAYQRRFGRPPAGYRAPSGIISAEDLRLLDRLDYRYDSSVFPVRRPGRYDFTALPRTAFRWSGLRLAEFPVALLSPRLPAGLSFINLLGPSISARLIRHSAVSRPSTGSPAPLVIDGHFHNLYSHPAALTGLPLALRAVYGLGRWSGGLACARKLVDALRRAGHEPASLHDLALRTHPVDLPAIDLEVFRRESTRYKSP